jgi:hypothetical protein
MHYVPAKNEAFQERPEPADTSPLKPLPVLPPCTEAEQLRSNIKVTQTAATAHDLEDQGLQYVVYPDQSLRTDESKGSNFFTSKAVGSGGASGHDAAGHQLRTGELQLNHIF